LYLSNLESELRTLNSFDNTLREFLSQARFASISREPLSDAGLVTRSLQAILGNSHRASIFRFPFF
jgi:hypothetical protein